MRADGGTQAGDFTTSSSDDNVSSYRQPHIDATSI
jgi:hypothetical protein